MAVFISVFIIMVLVILIMSVGVLMGRKPLAGSCGGLSAIGMKSSCDICGGSQDLCEKEQLRMQRGSSKAYDATDLTKQSDINNQ